MNRRPMLLSALFFSWGIANAGTYAVDASLSIRGPSGVSAGMYRYFGVFDDSELNNSTRQGTTNISLGAVCFFGPAPCPPSYADLGIQVYEPGDYADFAVSGGEYGGTMSLDWAPYYQQVSLANVWSVTAVGDGTMRLTATDSDHDGVIGQALAGGAWSGFNLGFDMVLTPTTVPVPGAWQLLLTGILGVAGILNRAGHCSPRPAARPT